MKKNLLLTGALFAIGMAAFAQEATVSEPLVKMNKAAMTSSKAYTEVTDLKPFTLGKSNVISRAVADGTYYTRPAGTFFRAWNEEGRGSYTIYLYMPAFKECTFMNKSANPTESKWYLINTNGKYDYTEYADASGNWGFEVDGQHVWPVPTLENGETQFVLGENNMYNDKGAGYTRMQGTGTVSPMSYFNDHDFDKNQLGWGVLSTHYLFGSGTFTQGDVTYTSVGAAQNYEKPASPLYVENAFIEVFSFEETTPIPAGTTITMAIVGTETEKTIATLTATAEDMVGYGSYTNTAYGQIYSGSLVFSNKVKDPILGVDIAEPFVIDEPFTVMITGMEQTGVNFGLGGVVNKEESGMLEQAGVLLLNPTTGKIASLKYTSPLAINVVFNGLFDGIHIWTDLTASGTNYSNGNVLKISDDGTTCTQTNGTNLPGVIIETATPWKDTDGNEYYYFENLPEWITAVNVDDSYYAENGYYVVSFTAEPLNGKDGEAAVLYLKGRGITAETPIYVTQGNGTTDISDAIVTKDEVKDNKVYNLNGQRVSENTQGILIKNGKKIINK